MTRSTSSRRWLERQRSDPYVMRARAEGYRARAAYKLLEIQDKDRILRPGMRVLDLGAAPGSWSQVATRLVGPGGSVFALDILDFDPIPGVRAIRGDFQDLQTLAALQDALAGASLDLILSDMAPNASGTSAVDQPRAMYLAELALDLARETLKPGGALVVKSFQGEGFDGFLRELRATFDRVAVRKPRASRSESREQYLVAKGLKSGSGERPTGGADGD